MSKIKSRYFDFINSDDYSMYNLDGTSEQQIERSKTAYKTFSDAGTYQGSGAGLKHLRSLKTKHKLFSKD